LERIILDTNICVDLFNGDLLKGVLELPYCFCLPDVVLAELKEPDGAALVSLGYKPVQSPPKTVEIAFQLAARYTKPSRADIFALAIAKELTITLLTGDDNLRKAAQSEQVNVHGLLWLMDKLFESKMVSGLILITALDIIIEKGAWLPKKEVEERKEKLK
jgi:rRNA-processing protein FCF1